MEELLAAHARILENTQLALPRQPTQYDHQSGEIQHSHPTRDRSLSKTESDGAIAGSLLRLAEARNFQDGLQDLPRQVTEERTMSYHTEEAQASSAFAPMVPVPEDNPLDKYTPLPPSHNIVQKTVEETTDDGLPPEDLLFALVDLFFQHVNTWIPLLNRSSTMSQLFPPTSSVSLEMHSQHAQRKPKRSLPDQILLNALVATSIRFSTDPRLQNDGVSRTRYHTQSKQRVLLYCMENSTLQALKVCHFI